MKIKINKKSVVFTNVCNESQYEEIICSALEAKSKIKESEFSTKIVILSNVEEFKNICDFISIETSEMREMNILTSRKIYRDDIADDTISKFKKIAEDVNVKFTLNKKGKKGEFIKLQGPADVLSKISVKEFGRTLEGEYASTSGFVDDVIMLHKKHGNIRFSEVEDEFLAICKNHNIEIVDIDTEVNWHMHKFSFVKPNSGDEINFNVGLANALPGIIKDFA